MPSSMPVAAIRTCATERRRAHSDVLDPRLPRPARRAQPINRVVHLLQAEPKELIAPDRLFLERLPADAPALAQTRDLAWRFAALVRKKGTETLDDWMAAAAGSPLTTFTAGLGKDLAAVQAALAMPWSTNPGEGQISRLKTIKLTMYGRAGFDLLRSRMLHAA